MEKEMATHSRIPAWETLWTEEPGGLPPMGSQRAGHDWAAEREHSVAHGPQGGSARGPTGRRNGKAELTPPPSLPWAASLEGAASPLWIQHQLGTPPWPQLPPGRPQLLDSTHTLLRTPLLSLPSHPGLAVSFSYCWFLISSSPPVQPAPELFLFYLNTQSFLFSQEDTGWYSHQYWLTKRWKYKIYRNAIFHRKQWIPEPRVQPCRYRQGW